MTYATEAEAWPELVATPHEIAEPRRWSHICSIRRSVSPSSGMLRRERLEATAFAARFHAADPGGRRPKFSMGRSEPPGRSGIDAVERALGPSEFVRPST